MSRKAAAERVLVRVKATEGFLVDKIFPLLQPHPLRFSRLLFFIIITINGFVTVVNVTLGVCLALSHSLIHASISNTQGKTSQFKCIDCANLRISKPMLNTIKVPF